METTLVFLGAGVGGVLRFWTTYFITFLFGNNFPYGTLIVNVSGCFLMGLFLPIIFERYAQISPELRSLILIGALGGYTTFSTFSIETIKLFESGSLGYAVINIFLSVILCLTATWLGMSITRFSP